MKYIFLPALADVPTPWAPGGTVQEPNIGNWLDDDLRETGAYYPHSLISWYSHGERTLARPADGFTLGDSGGFSILRYGMTRTTGARHKRSVDAKAIVEWQAAQCDVGLILDIPPPRGFDAALAQTLTNTRGALAKYEQLRADGTRFRLWGVAHGLSDAERNVWWRQVSDVYPFTDEGEGWAVKVRPDSNHPIGIAKALRWLRRKGIHRAHFLAAGGLRAIATLLALGPDAGLDFVTSDSMGVTTQAIHRTIFVPNDDGLGYRQLRERGNGREARDYLMEHCSCGSCAQLEADAARWPRLVDGKWNAYWLHRCVWHSLLIHVAVVRNMQLEARRDPHALLRHVLGGPKAFAVEHLVHERHLRVA